MECLTSEPRSKTHANPLLILLHGWNSNERDVYDMVTFFFSLPFDDLEVVNIAENRFIVSISFVRYFQFDKALLLFSSPS